MRLDKYCHVSLRLSLHQLAPVSSYVVGVETLRVGFRGLFSMSWWRILWYCYQ